MHKLLWNSLILQFETHWWVIAFSKGNSFGQINLILLYSVLISFLNTVVNIWLYIALNEVVKSIFDTILFIVVLISVLDMEFNCPVFNN